MDSQSCSNVDLGRKGQRARGWRAPVRVTLHEEAALVADAALLSAAERAHLAQKPFAAARRDEWIRGRMAVRASLTVPISLLSDEDGAPRVVGAEWAVSLSHEPGWVAVATRPGRARVAVDLVLASEAPRVARALGRLRVRTEVDARAAWAALECALKLRRTSVTAILERPIVIRGTSSALTVEGLGARVHARVWRRHDLVVAAAADADAAP